MHAALRTSLATLLAVLFGMAAFGLPALASEQRGGYYGAMHTEYPDWFKESFLTLADDLSEAKAAGRRLLILFHQDNCPYCNALIERNLSQKDIEDALRRDFDVIALNMWGSREVIGIDGQSYTEKSFAAAHKVQFTPTLLFLDESGQVALRLNGYVPPQRFKLALGYVAGRHEKSMRFRDYAAAREPTPGSGILHGEDFFLKPPHDLRRLGKGRPAIAVFFEQRDCPACDQMHRRLLVDAQTRKIARRLASIQLDMWSDQPVILPDGRRTTAREWARALNVQYAPSILLLDPSGREIIRSEAELHHFHTQSILDYAASGAYRTQPSFQRFLSDRAESQRERGEDVDIWRMADEPAGKVAPPASP